MSKTRYTQEEIDSIFNKKVEIKPTPEGIEFEKKVRSNPNNKIEGELVPGDKFTFQNMSIDAASFAKLFPNKTPKEIAKSFAQPAAAKTPQAKKS